MKTRALLLVAALVAVAGCSATPTEPSGLPSDPIPGDPSPSGTPTVPIPGPMTPEDYPIPPRP